MDLQQIRQTAERVARQAGDVLMRYWAQPHTETTKRNIYDIVTEGDKASEAVIVAALRERFPDHHIVSEEGGGTDLSGGTSDYFWYIDPVDGTTNFAHNLPYFSVSIALTDPALNPLVGVVYNPVTRELFSAARGFGTTLDGAPVRVSTTDRLDRALFASGFSSDKTRARENMRYWEQFMTRSRDLRRLGSAALDMCYVASGRLDGFWETGINSWDVLAGILCVQEAGGTATDFAGQTTECYTGANVVTSNGRLHAAMLDILNDRA